MEQFTHAAAATRHTPWNKGKLVGQKAPLKLKDIWAIRVRLQIADRTREHALFNLAIDSKLRSCDLVKLRVRDVCHGSVVAARHGHATKDSTTGAIRNHGADARIIAEVDPSSRSSLG
jgi:hypothetical protein